MVSKSRETKVRCMIRANLGGRIDEAFVVTLLDIHYVGHGIIADLLRVLLSIFANDDLAVVVADQVVLPECLGAHQT